MEFSTITQLSQRKKADLLVIPFWKGKKHAEPATAIGGLKPFIKGPIEAHDFIGKEDDVCFLYADGQPEPRIALLGLGEKDKITVERLRRSYAALTKACRAKRFKSLNILAPEITTLQEEALVKGMAEGLLLANYVFAKLKQHSVKDEKPALLQKVTWIGLDKVGAAVLKKCLVVVDGVYLARDLVNGNADDVTPQHLAQVAKELASTLSHVKATIFDKKRIEKEGMGLLLAVSRASRREPRVIILEYKGNARSKDTTILLGKGVTYDTGGLNLKPTGSMETMKCDMGGAATALGTLYAVAKLGLKTNLTVVIPSCENCIGGDSYKPGDVYQAHSGKTVEIGNTDAEGRLLLADALSYIKDHLNPTRVVDFATLTGAIDIALGAEVSGIMSNHDALADALMRSGYETYERLCRLPLYEEYRDQLRSDIADIKSTGGRSAGSITAALFLKEFIGDDVPWAHCDIASTAYLADARRYHPKHGSGVGVRLMVDFLEHL